MTVIFKPNEDILEQDLQAIAVPVNCFGAPYGLSEQCALKYPSWFMNYVAAAKSSKINVDKKPHIYQNSSNPLFILSIAVKREIWGKSQLVWIQSALEWLSDNAISHGINQIGIPKLGCGGDGLEWATVRALIVSYFQEHALEVHVFGE